MSAAMLTEVRALMSDPDRKTATFARALVTLLESRSVRRLNISELAQRLNRHPTTIARDYRAGRFPRPEYLGTRRVWREDVIEAWERECAAAPQVRKPRGVETWTPEQHRARESAKREKARVRS